MIDLVHILSSNSCDQDILQLCCSDKSLAVLGGNLSHSVQIVCWNIAVFQAKMNRR